MMAIDRNRPSLSASILSSHGDESEHLICLQLEPTENCAIM